MQAIYYDSDYKDHFFEYPKLTKIHNEPETQCLIIIRNEIKANTMTVHKTLVGGAYGHLGLVLTPAQYAQVPNSAPYEKPEHPGVYQVAPGTQFQIITNENEHHEAIRLFCEVQFVGPR